MKILPILFSTPMVQAILDGRKRMTRRVVKTEKDGVATAAGLLVDPNNDWCAGRLIKPKYQPGQILWVRETWAKISDYATPDTMVGLPDGYLYKATGEYHMGLKWRPSIFMPREAARIWLRVTDVRCERVQDITPYDAWCEGCRIGNSFPWEQHIPELQQQCRDILFHDLWDGLNAKRGYSWASNPLVWVIGFERCDKPQEVAP